MSEFTKIQWCDSTVNPVMGCSAPCELRPSPEKLHAESAKFFMEHFPGTQAAEIARALDEQMGDHNATEIFQLREHIVTETCEALAGTCLAPARLKQLTRGFKRMLDRHFICYAHQLHLMRGKSAAKPGSKGHPGYAPQFEQVTKFPGRTAKVARLRDLLGSRHEDKPWLNGLPRTIFVSDMADALSEAIDFEYLRRELIDVVTDAFGRRHIWLWLTKMPKRMAEFGEWLRMGGAQWPDNLVAMTSVTSQKTVIRAEQLKRVPARFKGLSVEPLWEQVTIAMNDVDWCIVGGQSGFGARPFDLAWARSLHAQCRASGTAFFVKQLGAKPVRGVVPLKLTDEHGGDWDEWPADLRIREMPSGFHSLGFDVIG